MIVEIQYKDKANWLSVDGVQTDWTNYSKKFKKERVQPYYVAPEIITDTWNGKESDIQHIFHDAYYFEILIKESEIKFIQQLKSSSDINIIQYQETDAGLIVNNSYTNIDLIKADLLTISEPERADITSGWKVSIIFKTNRTVINKALNVDYTNYISFQDYVWKNDFLQSIDGRITKLDSTSIATSGDLKKYTLSGETWTQTGNTLTGSLITDLTALDADTVASIDNTGNLITYAFDGTDWAQVGNTLNLPTIPDVRVTALTSTRIAVYKPNTITITTYDWSGTDWSQTGNALTIVAGFADIAGLTSSKIALADTDSAELRDYDFDGTDWTVNDTITANISGTYGAVAKLESNRVALISSGDDILESYILDSTWSLETGSLNLGTASYIIEAIDANTVYLGNTLAGNYSYGVYKYWTDYDVLDWNKDVEDVNVQWFDNTIKTAQKTNKDGFEYVQYILTSEHDEFLDYLKKAGKTTINGTEIKEVEFEKVLIAENLIKIIVRGIATTTVTTDYLTPNQDYNLNINDGVNPTWIFYTDYPPEFISESPEINQTNNQTGVNESTKAISKTVYQLKFYLSESDAFNLKKRFELLGTKTINPGATAILEDREVTPAKLGVDLYEVIVNCLTASEIN